jgi:hypothetical protein
MSKWIYKYLKDDKKKIDIGPYKTEEYALLASQEHS